MKQDLVKFVEQMRAVGKTNSEIFSQLKSSGWNENELNQLLKEHSQDKAQGQWYNKWWGIALIVILSMIPAVFFAGGDIVTVLLIFTVIFLFGIIPIFILIFVVTKLIEKRVFAGKRHFLTRNLFAITLLVIGITSVFFGKYVWKHPDPSAEIGNLIAFAVLIFVGVLSILASLLLLVIPFVWNIILKINQRKLQDNKSIVK